MEIMETGGKVAGIDLEGLGIQGSKNEFLINHNQKYGKGNPMTFPVIFFILKFLIELLHFIEISI
jgi:hypothetical protein